MFSRMPVSSSRVRIAQCFHVDVLALARPSSPSTDSVVKKVAKESAPLQLSRPMHLVSPVTLCPYHVESSVGLAVSWWS